ncbi:MAG: catalase [Geminicoccaceae bacterium]|nr:catalase [Geminicoccaceae bacterium]MCS7266453.1 catalase [Geminicoccaceae bacterium]MCX7630925.1 catalase [Geminicoccaceae bacterium]MDW8123951.1 catalase [Geminicoccaceae bacterium]MDW8339987.1 catalase [Geminicoccaceae bacterium]
MTGRPTLTTVSGAPVARRAGASGPEEVPRFDRALLEELCYFNRERIPERVVHAKGFGAHGSFTVTNELSRFTRAALFSKVGKRTPCLVRFSSMSGEQGSADLERDPRGFAVKFYTEEGNFDLVGSNLPVSFVRDPAKFPDLARARKRHPRSHLRSPAAMWDFFSLCPETLHALLLLYSDHGIPRAPFFMDGFGVHAFALWNRKGERFWAKFHFESLQGRGFLTDAEAERLIGGDRDAFARALFEAIERGEFPRWRLRVQILSEAEAERLPFDPFDPTKLWPEHEHPAIEVGVLELDRNPDNHFAEVEQAAFDPGNFVPGIGPSPDPVLQARLFAYADAQRYRLGTHYAALPINAPRCPVHHYHKDGAMRFFDNNTKNPDAFYEPNSFDGPVPGPEQGEPRPRPTVRRARREDEDDFAQPRAFLRSLEPEERARLVGNLARAMAGVPEFVARRQLALFARVEPALAEAVGAALGIRPTLAVAAE